MTLIIRLTLLRLHNFFVLHDHDHSAVVNLPGASTSAKRKYITVTIPSLDQYKDYKVRSAFMIDLSQFSFLKNK
jgi:hypothetical protein